VRLQCNRLFYQPRDRSGFVGKRNEGCSELIDSAITSIKLTALNGDVNNAPLIRSLFFNRRLMVYQSLQPETASDSQSLRAFLLKKLAEASVSGRELCHMDAC
jgi:hypothetical protein